MLKQIKFFVALSIGFLTVQPAQADTKSYTGMGSVVRDELTMNLGNGQMVFGARSQGMATISTEPPELLAVKCMGLGLVADKDNTETDIYCTFRRGNGDAFDVKAKSHAKGGVAHIIGGSGIWADATGSVTFDLLTTTDTGGSFSYKITISTPQK